MTRFRTTALAAIALALLASACDPVFHAEEPDAWEFEGFTVYSHVPDDPVGIVYVFHGTGGSAEIANKVETIDQLNELVDRGYGWVATASTERTGTKRWGVVDPSITTNPDLARLTRLHDELIDDTGVDATTPIFGIGMSNGARMVTLFGQVFANEGYPVAAVAPSMGKAAPFVQLTGGLTIPAFWVIAENDTTTNNVAIEIDQQANEANGVASSLAIKHEEQLLSARFTRIPEIDETEAEAIRDALVATGGWDDEGIRLLPIEDVLALVDGLSLPPSFGAPAAEVRSQIQAILAVHQFVALFRIGLADFFDAQLR